MANSSAACRAFTLPSQLGSTHSGSEQSIDNNVSEREMKRIVLNRKNSLFVGNARGGRTAAILASMTSTCRRLDIDPQLYLTQLLTNLPTLPISQLPQWLPDQWKSHHAARHDCLQKPAPRTPEDMGFRQRSRKCASCVPH